MQEHAKGLQPSHLGTTFLATFGGALYLGYLADQSLGTTPLLMLVGVAVGFGAGFYYLYYEIFIRPKWEREQRAAKLPSSEPPAGEALSLAAPTSSSSARPTTAPPEDEPPKVPPSEGPCEEPEE